MLKKILLAAAAVIVLAVVGFVILVAMQPTKFHIERSATMKAPPAEVFAQVNDFHNWDAWSPWLELDPNSKVTYEGPTEGEGAIFRWAGNDQVGEGSMKILESKPHEKIAIELHFIKPFEDTAQTDFLFKPEGEGTNVTWTMDGQNNFIAKVFCLFMDMDEMIGSKYEEGLASIKGIVEAPEEPAVEPAGADTSLPAEKSEAGNPNSETSTKEENPE